MADFDCCASSNCRRTSIGGSALAVSNKRASQADKRVEIARRAITCSSSAALSFGTLLKSAFDAQISMSTLLAEECRKCAPECAKMAEQQEDAERKRQYSDLATMWRLIAKDSEETHAV